MGVICNTRLYDWKCYIYDLYVRLINTPTNAHTHILLKILQLFYLNAPTCFDNTIILREHTQFLAKVIV